MKAEIANERLAYALLRIFVGLNMMMHGLSRMIAGLSEFASKLQLQFAHSPLPPKGVLLFGTVLPVAEMLLGLFLLIGFKTRAALIGGSIWLLILTFGSALIQDWQAAGTQLVYALAYAALLFLLRFNALSIDTLGRSSV
jgi:thiosulfate dehydrogenase [quinone] large subunit